jgi:drug/metabolite transporter (DMT)-like permease
VEDQLDRRGLLSHRASGADVTFGPLDWGVFLAVSAIWGASFLFIAEGLESLEPGVVTWGRVGLGALALAPLPAARRRIAREDRRALVLLSLLWVAIPFTLFPLAQMRLSSAVAGMLNGSMPLFTALVAVVFLRTLPGRTQAAGLALGLAGVAVISLAQTATGENDWLGVALVLAATTCYAFAVHIAAPLQQRYGSVALMARILALATLWTAPFGLAGLPESRFEITPVLAVTVLGVAGTGLAFALMATLVGRVGSTRASFITYLIPVVALVLGVAVRGEHVRPAATVGVGLVIAGALLASRGEPHRLRPASWFARRRVPPAA